MLLAKEKFMKIIIALSYFLSQFLLAQVSPTRTGSVTTTQERSSALRKLVEMSSNSSNYKDSIPYFWSESIDKSSVMTQGTLSVIDDKILQLSQRPEVVEWVDYSAKNKFDNMLKTLSPNQQLWAKGQAEFGNAGLDFFSQQKQPIVQVDVFKTPEEMKKLALIFSSETENMKKWNSIDSSLATGSLVKECELEIKLTNGQRITLFGTATEVTEQLKKYNLDGLTSDKIESTTLKRINRFKMEALFEAFNQKNGKVFTIMPGSDVGNYTKFRQFVQGYNFEQKPNIKLPMSAKIGSVFKGGAKTVGIGALFGIAAGVAVASEQSSIANDRLNTAPTVAAPKIQKSSTGQ